MTEATARLRASVAQASRRLAAEGLLVGTAGNVSARDGDRVAHHQIADAEAAQCLLGRDVARLPCRGLEQEPAEESEPRAAECVLRHEEEDAAGDRTRPNLKIQDGCNNRCSFCIIPFVRGRSRSSSPEMVVEQVRSLAGRYREVVLTGVDSVWKVHEHEAQEEHAQETAAAGQPGSASAHAEEPAVTPGREVTMALVRYATPLAAASLPRQINAESSLQSASPAYESARLFTVFGVGTDVIRGFALFLIASAALGMFIALYQAMDARQYDLAIMRTLGASRVGFCAWIARFRRLSASAMAKPAWTMV